MQFLPGKLISYNMVSKSVSCTSMALARKSANEIRVTNFKNISEQVK
jgi:hypothetical protein